MLTPMRCLCRSIRLLPTVTTVTAQVQTSQTQSLTLTSVLRPTSGFRRTHSAGKSSASRDREVTNPSTAFNEVSHMVETEYDECKELISNGDLVLISDFITEEEEHSIMKEIQPYFARLRYEYSHWDDVSS